MVLEQSSLDITKDAATSGISASRKRNIPGSTFDRNRDKANDRSQENSKFQKSNKIQEKKMLKK